MFSKTLRRVVSSSLYSTQPSAVFIAGRSQCRWLKVVSSGPEDGTSSADETWSQRSPTPPPPPPSSPASSSASSVQQKNWSTAGNADGSKISPTPAETESTPVAPSYEGMSTQPFPDTAQQILMAPINVDDIELKPDGTVYLPEIKYRRILNRAFGPGGWAMKPVEEAAVEDGIISRTYQLFCLGRFVSEARGEQQWHAKAMSRPSAEEAAKSNAVMRCCKDLGIASELWDPTFLRQFKKTHMVSVWAENKSKGGKRLFWKLIRDKDEPLPYPWKETGN